MIESAAFVAVSGLVGWLYLRRKGQRYMGWSLLLGLPGVYLVILALIGAPKWLYIPGFSLVGSSYLFDIALWRRQRADKSTVPPDSNDPS